MNYRTRARWARWVSWASAGGGEHEAPVSGAGGGRRRLEQEAAPSCWSRRRRPAERLRQHGGAQWWAWRRVVAGVGRGGGRGGARWLGGEEACTVKFDQSSLEVILQKTAALFPFLQVDCFSGCPTNMVLEEDFAGNGCGYSLIPVRN
jgi:hypothetical protein